MMSMKASLLTVATAVTLALPAHGLSLVCRQAVGGSRTALLEQIQTDKSDVLPENIEQLDNELKTFLSAHRGKRILIFTDATAPYLTKGEGPQVFSNGRRAVRPQTSGVITVMRVIKEEIEKNFGIEVRFVTPEEFGIHYQIDYQDVIIPVARKKELERIIGEKDNLAVHIMVEGALGKAAKSFLKKRNIPYSTAYHTDFPQYVLGALKFYSEKTMGMKTASKIMSFMERPRVKETMASLVLSDLARFHAGSEGVMVPTKAMLDSLIEKGFPAEDLRLWSHGVDLEKFKFNSTPNAEWYEAKAQELGLIPAGAKIKRPIMLFVGRVGEEKNIDFFLDLPVEGTKVVVGDGPLLAEMKQKYKEVLFFGRQPHENVPLFMANADIFPFASRSETFGLVNLEAAATGTPVVVFDYLKEIIASPQVGRTVPYTGDRQKDLLAFAQAVRQSLALNRAGVRTYAEKWSWHKSIVEMLVYLKYLTPEQTEALRRQ